MWCFSACTHVTRNAVACTRVVLLSLHSRGASQPAPHRYLAVDGIICQPDIADDLRGVLLLSFAFMEALTMCELIIALMLLFPASQP